MTTRRPLLQAEALRLAYPSRRGAARAGLCDVTLDLAQGECVALIGPSGAGKTSLARAILGLLPLEVGRVTLEGRDIAGVARPMARETRARIQMIFQDPLQSFDARRSLGDQVADSLCNFGTPRPEAKAAAADVFARLGLDPALLSRRPAAVSGGQLQRAAIARALIVAPDVLIADEALSASDAALRSELTALLQAEQARRGMALLLISHDMALVAEMAHRVVVIEDGRLVEEGPTAQVLEHPIQPVTRGLLAAARATMGDGCSAGGDQG
ncbi:ABC transporter ATP-binding protein [Roseovarius sp. C7]|uniref:ABC transporter ATP-binding protein n=1 Tax=Roseovarius sp. C7 TaxID=3398643 RepID=UPI0039F6C0FC